MSIKEKLFAKVPHPIQNSMITAFNSYQYKIRHGGAYKEFRKYYANIDKLTEPELIKEIEAKKNSFFEHVKLNSTWYKGLSFDNFEKLPILEKSDIINNLKKIQTIDEKKGLVSFTGGTTGASMKVVYTKSDMQERFAILDHFRSKHGYRLGKKTAWFSGKNLIVKEDISKGICSHYDFINKIKFYSTFHINQKNFEVYWKSLSRFKPEFIVGFPSSVYEICEIADRKGLRLEHTVKVFFPTAETVLPQHREVISRVLGCKLVDQYASSEGAPFILECEAGNLHFHPLTGILEVVDEYMNPSKTGKMLVTSFTTHGTPLIRYDIGDSVTLGSKNKSCKCGSYFPLVDKIEGRTTDYLISPTHGKVNLGNISNSTKDIKGIIKFQAIQYEIKIIKVLVVSNSLFDIPEQNKFIAALKERMGPEVDIHIKIVEDIATEPSGKFRIVKNMLAH